MEKKAGHTVTEIFNELHLALESLEGIPGTMSARERIARVHLWLGLPLAESK